MSVSLINFDNEELSKSKLLNTTLFDCDYNGDLVHQLVVKYLANGKTGTKAQKTRSEVSGGGMKPWRQKGTGRARSGSSRSPIWRGGGVNFAAKPGIFTQKLNKKMYKLAIRTIFSELIRQNRVLCTADIFLETSKTKDLLKNLGDAAKEKLLIIVDKIDINLALASRNLISLEVIEATNLNPVYLVSYENIVITDSALGKLKDILV
ncbi:MAG: 50S ribosomal protein L4 [Methylovulum sp.]|nr:50S ribosomal protein L4 [Methylovulum sp.]TSA40590.1 MAG: 50S ribosomal protein L4 [Methylococcaceae bacterium]